MAADDTLSAVDALHAEVDAESARLGALLGSRLRCGPGCHECCVDEFEVFEVEAELVRQRHGEFLAEGKAHPAGACAFLDRRGACRIHESQPCRCRSHGLPRRWIEPGPDDEPVERREICSLNE